MKYWSKRVLVFTAIVALLSVSISSVAVAQPAADTTFVVNPVWLGQHVNDPTLVVVDVRPNDAYSAGHIPGAINVPWSALGQPNTDESQIAPWQEQMMTRLGTAGIAPDNMVVSYDDNGNLYAARMRWVLKYLGHDKAAVLDGGVSSWTDLGEPLSVEPMTRGATIYTATPNPELLATWSYVLERLGNPDVQILDVRPAGSYTGEAAGTDLHAGHIPGALNLDWNNLVQSQAPRTFKSIDELRSAYDAIGLQPDKEVIVYCVTGIASADSLLTLEMLGYPNVRLYSASWAEWGNREDLPFVAGPDPGA